MEFRQLHYFVKAAETMNFTEAAAAVFITQSTLSQQIKQLEEELGMLLFDRIGKHVRITEAGHVFLTHARKILLAVQKSKQAISELNNAATGELNVGVSYAFTSSLFPVLAPFSTKYPGIKIFIASDNHEELEKKLRLAELDLIVAYHNESDDEDLEMQPLFSSSIVMVVAKNNPLAQLKSVNLKQLSELELILPGKGFSSRMFINELFYKNKMSLNIKIELNDVHSLLLLVQEGEWATILNEKTLIGWDKLVAIPIAGQEVKKQSYILWQKGVYRKKAAILFTEQLMATMNN
ncbi:LysR substrate-binding domain-containing protein [Mucilaginibacter lappiensis]|uniref:LysR family cyn operon transcriptional activator n=1 Tax=Mucilaginibacter lappiensis TaxID=354630 RepID=A0A1N6SW71_9SPHI|nr:LysR substrate-binding domain-containing protein [Mucilaginibacter lappiensis]MBB6108255.1 LysR family cyn operon transcriptional activator [Mucilaginibacter lappiensis]MBB6129882.1 LysR family cyn operon transcriptional activator [Mucilaginibacter lappiensis]SIQ45363.1 LysR family transcriptional regulator, cyn operon transcriptional activator [Mucilaginibacter lappiensis]